MSVGEAGATRVATDDDDIAAQPVAAQAAQAGDGATAEVAATAVESRLEALLDALAALDAGGEELVAPAGSGRHPGGGDTAAR